MSKFEENIELLKHIVCAIITNIHINIVELDSSLGKDFLNSQQYIEVTDQVS